MQKRYTGQADVPLSANGERQGRCLAQRLSGEPIDAVYSSDLERAWRTAELITEARDLAVRQDVVWREISYGAWEGLTGAEIKAQFPEEYRRWSDDVAWVVAPPGGESWLALQERAIAGVDLLRTRHERDTVLVVTHSALLMALGVWLHGYDFADSQAARMDNGGLSCIVWEQPEPEIRYWNDLAHLG